MIAFELAESVVEAALAAGKSWSQTKVEGAIVRLQTEKVSEAEIEAKALGAAADPDAEIEGSIRTWNPLVHEIKQKARAKQASKNVSSAPAPRTAASINGHWDAQIRIARSTHDPDGPFSLDQEIADLESARTEELARHGFSEAKTA